MRRVQEAIVESLFSLVPVLLYISCATHMNPVLLLVALYASVFAAAKLRKSPMNGHVRPEPPPPRFRETKKSILQVVVPKDDISLKTKGGQGVKSEHPKQIYENRKMWIDAATLLVGIGTLILLYRTVEVAQKQWEKMDETVIQMKRANDLTFQQLNGTQGAVIVINGFPGIGNLPQLRSSNSLSIPFKNEGHVTAADINVVSTISLLNPGGKAIRSWPCNRQVPILMPGRGDDRSCLIDHLSSGEIRNVQDLRTDVIAWDGFYQYNNGFELKRVNVCYRYSPQVKSRYGTEGSGHLVTCEDFVVERELVRAHLAEKQ